MSTCLYVRINIATPNVIDSGPRRSISFNSISFLISSIVGKGSGAHQPPFTFHSHVFCPWPLVNQNCKILHLFVVQIQCTVWMTQTYAPKWHVSWFSLKLNVAILIILADTIHYSKKLVKHSLANCNIQTVNLK